jgi:transposase
MICTIRATPKIMEQPSSTINIVNLDHLGIVAGIIDEMELVEEVNKTVGIKTRETMSPGQVMKAMILNGLGFLSAPIYLFDTFFIGKATEHLIGEGVTPEQLNDDRIGRARLQIPSSWNYKPLHSNSLESSEEIPSINEERSPR